MTNFKVLFAGSILCIGTALFLGYSNKSKESKPVQNSFSELPIDNNQLADFEPDTFTSIKNKSQSGHISFGTELEHNAFEIGKQHTCYYYAEISSDRYTPNAAKIRPSLNISVVIDRSGSMEGEKLSYAKKAAHFIVDNLSKDDMLSIVVYDDEITVLLPSQKVINKEQIHQLIKTISERGSTNLGGGMQKGIEEVKKLFKPNAVNRVLLLTDGLANVGITEPMQLNAIARTTQRSSGISISSFGIGLDFNEDLLQNLAENGNGNYYFIASPESIPDIFKKELNGLLNVVAQEMTLEVEIPEGVKIEKVFGYSYQVNGQILTVKFKDIFSEETKAVLIKYTIWPSLNKALKFESTLHYTDVTGESVEKVTSLKENRLDPATSNNDFASSLNTKVAQQVVLFESNEKQEEAMQALDKGEYQKARTITSENKIYLQSKLKTLPKSKELQRQDSVITSYEEKIKKAETLGEDEKKYMQKSMKMENYSVRKKK